MDLSAYEQRQAVHTRTSRIIGIFRNASVGTDLSVLVSGPGSRVVGGILMSVSEMARQECGFYSRGNFRVYVKGASQGAVLAGTTDMHTRSTSYSLRKPSKPTLVISDPRGKLQSFCPGLCSRSY